jgi:excisionase family DNA binding protein
MPEGTPTYLTTGEAAQRLGVSAQTVVNWIDQGRLPAIRTLGGHRRIALGDLLELATQLDTTPEPAA